MNYTNGELIGYQEA